MRRPDEWHGWRREHCRDGGLQDVRRRSGCRNGLVRAIDRGLLRDFIAGGIEILTDFDGVLQAADGRS